MISTADDLAVFARALFTGELFDEAATLDAMLEVSSESQKVASPGDWPPPTGLGVEIRGDTYGKEGQILGYSARSAATPLLISWSSSWPPTTRWMSYHLTPRSDLSSVRQPNSENYMRAGKKWRGREENHGYGQ
jgi:hypothetical protein